MINRQVSSFRSVSRKVKGMIFIAALAFLGSCDKTSTASTVVDFNINLNDQNSRPLKTQGGYIYNDNVIIAYTTNGAYVALSQACPYDNTTLIYDGNGDKFHCPADLSNFSDGGGVINGPATAGLTKYTVSHVDANTLRIQN